jgi:hypothetical protein
VSAVAAPAAVAIAALAGLAAWCWRLALHRIRIDLRARNIVETLVIAILIGCLADRRG